MIKEKKTKKIKPKKSPFKNSYVQISIKSLSAVHERGGWVAGVAECPVGWPLGEESLRLCPARTTAAEAEPTGEEPAIVMEMIGEQK